MVVVAGHTPCGRGGGGGHGQFLLGAAQHRRGCLTGCLILQGIRFVTFRVSHHRFMGCPFPQYGGFESFRVSDQCFMGCPIPQCGRFESFHVSRGAQSRNFGCASNKYIVCHAMVVCCCVSRGNAQNCMHFTPPKKTAWQIDPSTTFTSISISSRHRLHCVVPKPPFIA